MDLNSSIFNLEKTEALLLSLAMEKIEFLQGYTRESNFLTLKSSRLHIQDFKLQNQGEIFFNYLICFQNSTLYFENLEIHHCSFNELIFLILQTMINFNEKYNKVYFFNCKFNEIFAEKFVLLLTMNGDLEEFVIQNSTFKNMIINNDFIDIQSKIVTIENVFFFSNNIISNMRIRESEIVFFKNVSCLNNNRNNSIISTFFGNCFMINAKISIQINGLKIIGCYSYGPPILIIKAFFYEDTDKNSLISNGIFIKNRIFIQRNYENLGGVIQIITQNEFILENSRFSENILQMDKKIFAYGPCMMILSTHNVLIRKSYFEMNKASKFSNCIFSVCQLMNISDSTFSNNSISSLSEENYTLLFNERELGETYFDVGESKGGGLFANAKILIIINSSFLYNKANLGSAIYIEDDSDSVSDKIIKVESCIFYHNQALFSSTIMLGLISTFQLSIFNSSISHNLAYIGGVTQLNFLKDSQVILSSNFFCNNIANVAPVIGTNPGPGIIYGFNNTFARNEIRAALAKVGGSLLISSGSIVYFENHKYIENICYHGALSLFMAKALERNSIYIKNEGVITSALGLSNSATYFGSDIKFVNNFADTFGCVGSIEASEVRLENSLFFNLTSNHRGSCILAQDRSFISILNSYFYLNLATSLNMIELNTLKEGAIFKNCSFLFNFVTKLFDVVLSELVLEDSLFFSSNGTILFITDNTNVVLRNCSLINIDSAENIIYVEESDFTSILTNFFFIKAKGSLITSVFSNVSALDCISYDISVLKQGAFVDGISSDISIRNIHLININFNCIYLIACNMNLNNTYFLTRNDKEFDSFTFMIIFSSKNVFINNFFCIGSKDKEIQIAQFTNNPTRIFVYNSYFKYGFAIKGGAIQIKDSQIEIDVCYFNNNRARKGGAIYQKSIYGKMT